MLLFGVLLEVIQKLVGVVKMWHRNFEYKTWDTVMGLEMWNEMGKVGLLLSYFCLEQLTIGSAVAEMLFFSSYNFLVHLLCCFFISHQQAVLSTLFYHVVSFLSLSW